MQLMREQHEKIIEEREGDVNRMEFGLSVNIFIGYLSM